MTIESTLKLDGRDLNRIFDMCGHFSRATDSDQYQKLVPFMTEAAQELAQRAFAAGREFERTQLQTRQASTNHG